MAGRMRPRALSCCLVALGAAALAAACGGQVRATGDRPANGDDASATADGPGEHEAGPDVAPGAEGGPEAGACDPAACSSGCCGAATCADLDTDAANCGACGHDCLGGACTGGLCQPLAIASVPAGTEPWALAVGSTGVYFATFEGSLFACPKAGCTKPTTLTTALSGPDALLFDSAAGTLLVADTKNDAVDSYTPQGSLVFQDTAQSHPTALASDASYVYWTVAGGIVRSTPDGQNLLPIATGIPRQISSLAVDPGLGTVYASLISSTGSIVRLSTGGSGAWAYFAGTDTTAQANPLQIAVQGADVYWITQGNDPAYDDGGVYTCPASGCASPTAVPGTTPLTQGACLFTDATSIHYIANGAFYRCALAGCPAGPTRIATRQIVPAGGSSCAEDATSYYFLDGTGAVLRLAK